MFIIATPPNSKDTDNQPKAQKSGTVKKLVKHKSDNLELEKIKPSNGTKSISPKAVKTSESEQPKEASTSRISSLLDLEPKSPESKLPAQVVVKPKVNKPVTTSLPAKTTKLLPTKNAQSVKPVAKPVDSVKKTGVSEVAAKPAAAEEVPNPVKTVEPDLRLA